MDFKVFYGSPEKDADLLYFGGFRAPDPFLAFEADGRRVAVLSPLELDRGLREGRFDEVLAQEDVLEQSGTRGDLAGRILWLARQRGASRLLVPEDFPARTAFELRERGTVPLEFLERPVCPERIRKTPDERASILRVNEVVSGAFREVERILAAAEIRGADLWLGSSPLTSELVRTRIAVHCLENGCLAESTIVAGGEQACDPHERGSGPLRAGELIIVDIFPRDEVSGYFGDMTRTYCKGGAAPEARRLVQAVRDARSLALDRLRGGVDGAEVHAAVAGFFAERGFVTRRTEAGYEGFFHGTGHGLGLEVHEQPRVSRGSSPLEAGMVTTVEPGLYYRGVGGCRIEDVVALTADGVEMLSNHPIEWEIE